MARIPCDESFVPNTIMEIVVNSLGNQTQYCFTPDDGYVIHLKRDEVEDIDPETGDTVINVLYARGTKSVNINYDFSVVVNDVYTYTDENGNTVNIPIEKIGAEELYTLPESIVPSAQIYGVGNDHEVM